MLNILKKIIIAILLLSLVSCSLFNTFESTKKSKASIYINIDDSSTRTILPDFSIDHFKIYGTSDSGQTFSIDNTTLRSHNIELTIENWDLTIDGFNTDNEIIATGTTSITPANFSDNYINVYLSFLQVAKGSIKIDINWPVEVVIDEVLVDYPGEVSMDIYSTGNSVTFTKNEVNSGSSLLKFTLKKSGIVLATLFRAIHIYDNQESYDKIDLLKSEISSPPSEVSYFNCTPYSSKVELEWGDHSYISEGYIIERKATNETEFSVIKTASPLERTFIDSNIAENSNYEYRIKAFNNFGESSYISDSVFSSYNFGNLSEVVQLDENFSMSGIVYNNYIITRYYDRVIVFDISSPANPIEVYNYKFNGIVIAPKVYDNKLYFVENNFGLRVYNINPDGSLTAFSNYEERDAVFVEPGENYIALTLSYEYNYRRNYTFQLLDSSDLTNITYISEYSEPDYIDSMLIDNGFLHTIYKLSNDKRVIKSFNLIDTANLSPVTTTDIDTIDNYSNDYVKISIFSGYYYIFTRDRIDIFQKSAQAGLTFIKSLTGSNFSNTVYLGFNSNKGFVLKDELGGANSIHILDMSDPLNPQFTGYSLIIPSSDSFTLSNNIIFTNSDVNNYYNTIVSIDNPHPLFNEKDLRYIAPTTDIEIVNNYLFQAKMESGLEIYDITNPLSPVSLGSARGYSKCVAIEGNYAYVGGKNYIYTVNIENPNSPNYDNAVQSDGIEYIRSIAVGEGILVVTGKGSSFHSNKLNVFDIATNPKQPSLLYSWEGHSGEDFFEIAIENNYIYLFDLEDFTKFNFSDKNNIIKDGIYEHHGIEKGLGGTSKAVKYLVSGNILYASTNRGVFIYDISDNANHTFINRIESIGGSMFIRGNQLFVVSGLSSYQVKSSVYNISDLTNITFDGYFSVPNNNVDEMLMYNDVIYTAQYDDGLLIYAE